MKKYPVQYVDHDENDNFCAGWNIIPQVRQLLETARRAQMRWANAIIVPEGEKVVVDVRIRRDGGGYGFSVVFADYETSQELPAARTALDREIKLWCKSHELLYQPPLELEATK